MSTRPTDSRGGAAQSNQPVEIFRSHSSIEAEVVRGLLDAHGIDANVSSGLQATIFPQELGQTAFRVTVRAAAAAIASGAWASPNRPVTSGSSSTWPPAASPMARG